MERRQLIVVLCIIVVAFGVACTWSIFTSPNTSIPDSSQPYIERTATVSYVIDGDTITLQGGEKVRLVGIDTPEVLPHEEPGGREAKEFIETLCPPGTQIGLNVDDLDPTDRYGRTLAVVYVKIDGSWTNLNAELLRKGHAEILFIPPSEFNPYKWVS